jgi:hypothetical protein
MPSQAIEVASRASALSISIEGDALLGETAECIATLGRLVDRSALLGDTGRDLPRDAVTRIAERLDRRELFVALAGVAGSGKRSFLDALYGDPRLGQARGRSQIRTFLGNGATPRYRAMFTDGTTEDFARSVPDLSREHDERLRSAEQAFARAQRAHAELEAQAKTARDVSERAREEARRVAHNAESALEIEQTTSTAFGAAQQGEAEARRALTVAERAVPVGLRKPSHLLGFWTRIGRALFVVFKTEAWRALEQARTAWLGAQERMAAMRERLTEAADELQRARELVRAPQAVAEARRAEADKARARADDASGHLERARLEMDRRREELSRYVAERLARFFEGIRRVCSTGTADAVVELAIEYPSELIPEDVVLIDVPDIGDEKKRLRAAELLQEVADACVLIWDQEREVDAHTIELLRSMQRVLPHFFVVLNKMDATYLGAVRDGYADPWERVEAARAEAMSRFAEAVGTNRANVVSVAVAAKAALEDPESGLARRFHGETTVLFELLRQERTLLLGSRTTDLLATIVPKTLDAERRAEAAYKAHVAELEAHRMPEPEAFHRNALQDAEPLIERASATMVEDVSGLIRDGYAKLRASLDAFASTDAGGPQELLAREQKLAKGARKLEGKVNAALVLAFSTIVTALESRILDALGTRYRIPEVRPIRSEPPTLPIHADVLAVLDAPKVPALVGSYRRSRLTLALAGIAGGASLGFFAAPAVARSSGLAVPREIAAAGVALVGSLFAFAKSWSGTRARAIAAIGTALGLEEEAALRRVDARRAEISNAIWGALNASIGQAVIRYGRQMSEPTEIRERALHDERTSLGELSELAEALEQHFVRLTTLTETASDLSTFQRA